MSKSARSCPGNLTLITTPRRTCGGDKGCVSAIFHTHGISYSQVCGRLRGYQVGNADGFGPYLNNLSNTDTVIDKVLISHGKTQKHIWANATAHQRTVSSNSNPICPCGDPR